MKTFHNDLLRENYKAHQVTEQSYPTNDNLNIKHGKSK